MGKMPNIYKISNHNKVEIICCFLHTEHANTIIKVYTKKRENLLSAKQNESMKYNLKNLQKFIFSCTRNNYLCEIDKTSTRKNKITVCFHLVEPILIF